MTYIFVWRRVVDTASDHAREFERLRRQALENLARLEVRLEAAVIWEREQCAKIADTYRGDKAAETIAALIRARSYTS